MTITAEAHQKALDDAKTATERAETAEKALATEKKLVTELEEKLKAMTERAEKAEAEAVQKAVKALVGKKLIPAQVEVYTELAKSKGLAWLDEHAKGLPDISLTQRVKVGDKHPEGTDQPAPEPVATQPGGASAALSKRAQEAAAKAS